MPYCLKSICIDVTSTHKSSYLEEKIEWYEHNYRKGTPLITDAQFDQLETNL